MRSSLAVAVVVAAIAGCGGDRTDEQVFRSDDQEAMDRLERSGADLSRPRLLDFFLYFGGEDDARSAARDVAEIGGRISVDGPSARAGQWVVVLTKRLVLSRRTLGELQGRLTAVAASHDGEYDGWEAPAEP